MARKHKTLGRVLTVGLGAAAAYLLFRKRELLRSFFEELAAPPREEGYEGDVIRFDPNQEQSAPATSENDIIIDRTAEGQPIAKC